MKGGIRIKNFPIRHTDLNLMTPLNYQTEAKMKILIAPPRGRADKKRWMLDGYEIQTQFINSIVASLELTDRLLDQNGGILEVLLPGGCKYGRCYIRHDSEKNIVKLIEKVTHFISQAVSTKKYNKFFLPNDKIIQFPTKKF